MFWLNKGNLQEKESLVPWWGGKYEHQSVPAALWREQFKLSNIKRDRATDFKWKKGKQRKQVHTEIKWFNEGSVSKTAN